MYYIKKSVFNDLLSRFYPDYINKTIMDHEHNGTKCPAGAWSCFECIIPGAPKTGATLIFEYIHFEIIPD